MGDSLPGIDPARRDRLPGVREGPLNAVTTSGLTKIYGTKIALAGINLEIPAGSVYGLVGPNGSGKTTTLDILGGLRRPTAGDIQLGVSPDAVAYCPDVAEFEPWLTALEVLDAASGLLGRPKTRAQLEAMLTRVGLADVAGRRVGGFSRGMLSRLGLAAGLVGDPALILADEPVAAVDPAGRAEVLDLIVGLAAAATVVFSSHNLADVEQVCDRVGILAEGRLVYQGAIAELLAGTRRVWRVLIRPPADRLRDALAAAPWVTSVSERRPGHLTLEVSDPQAAELQLPRILAASAVCLIEAAQERATLEDVFLSLTAAKPDLDSAGHGSVRDR
jgi:ABC-2 type transport system ATP-binding protein